MQIKLKKSLNEYKYILMFDLASKNTGVCLWSIEEAKPLFVKMIIVDKKNELPAGDLYNLIEELFNKLEQEGFHREEILVGKEAMPTQLRGGSSTVQTFIALARSHAILDLYTYNNNIDIYDYVGIYPASTHAYLKKLRGWDNKHKVEKTDIQDYVKEFYNIECDTNDESDAVFLAKTFIEVKWNKDIEESIREIKRHKKTLKLKSACDKCDEEIHQLENLKN